jgi:predicted phage tail protein
MPSEPSANAAIWLLCIVIGLSMLKIVHVVVGEGRSLGAYAIGTAVMLLALLAIIAAIFAAVWVIGRIAQMISPQSTKDPNDTI